MSKQFRVKLHSGRIIGPIQIDGIITLKDKGHLVDGCFIQEYPIGDWVPCLEFLENNNIEMKAEVSEDGSFREFQYNKGELGPSNQESIDEDGPVETPVPIDLDKTQIISSDISSVDKTVILKNSETIVKIDELIENDDIEVEQEDSFDEKTKSKIINFDEKTEIFELEKLLPQIEEELELYNNKLLPSKKEEETNLEEVEKAPKSKKRMRPIAAIVFLFLFWMILFDNKDDVPEINLKPINIVFPVSDEYEDLKEAKIFLEKGQRLYFSGSYVDKLKAANNFKKSLQKKFRNNDALGYLILTYADLFENATNKYKASKVLFQLIEIGRSKLLTDVNVAVGAAIFYKKYDKFLTARNILENFLRVSGKSVKLLAIYLDILIEQGDLVTAKTVYEMLAPIKNKNIEAYIAMTNFEDVNENYEKAVSLIARAGKEYRNHVGVLIKYANMLFKLKRYKNFNEVLVAIRILHVEDSVFYYANFLRLKGLSAVIEKKPKIASQLFKKSLDLYNFKDLRAKLAELEVSGDKAEQYLILESKVDKLLKKIKVKEAEYKWGDALRFAVQASDLLPYHLDANLALARIQIRRGYLKSAIGTLNRLKSKHGLSKEVSSMLVDAYIKSKQLNKARQIIVDISTTKVIHSDLYASLSARYFIAVGDGIQTLRWLKESISRNPLNDHNYYLLAKTLMKNHEFENAKVMIVKAINLDPVNMDYHGIYAQIFYEIESADIGISYLRELLEKHPDNPKLLSDIAKFYYKSGLVKDFEFYLEKVKKLPNKSEDLFRFLVESSRFEDDFKKVEEYSRELLRINPGDLDTKLDLAIYFINFKKYEYAKILLSSIIDRLSNFPRVHFLLAKIHLEKKEYDKAIEAADIEIKENPKLAEGYFIKGMVEKEKQDFARSVKSLEKSIELNPRYVEALVSLGRIKVGQRHYEEARELFIRAQKEDELNPIIQRYLGDVYKAIGQREMAVFSYKRYLQLLPNARDAQRVMGLIRQLQ